MRTKNDPHCRAPKLRSFNPYSSPPRPSSYSSSCSPPASMLYIFCNESSSSCPPSQSTFAAHTPSISTPTAIKDLCSAPSDITSLIFDQYIVLGPVEASTLCQCMNRSTLESFPGKVICTSDYEKYLAPFFLLKNHNVFNDIKEICVCHDKTLIVFNAIYNDLHYYLRSQKKLEENEAKRLFHQIARITADCHRRGVIIRDLKLRKLVFMDPARTKLALEAWDDAIVLPDPNNALLDDRHGCPTYVSPEVLSKSNRYYSGKAADCWSLGIILYTLLAGRYPFRDSNPCSLFNKIRRGDFETPSNISSSAEFLIRSLLRKDPAGRIAADDLIHARWFQSKDDTYNPRNYLLVPSMESSGQCNPERSSCPHACGKNLPWLILEQVVPESTVTSFGECSGGSNHVDDDTSDDGSYQSQDN